MNAENVKVLDYHLSHGLEFEKRHKMSSNNFYKKFKEGKLGDDREYIKWFAYKDTYKRLKERLKEIERNDHG